MSVQKISQPIYILDSGRSIIGNPYKSFKDFTAVQIASSAIARIIQRAKIKSEDIGEVILGNAVSAGLGQNISRQASMQAGLSEEIPAYMVNNVCGAGLQSVLCGVQSILAHDTSLIISGGVESATHAPYLIKRDDFEEHKKKECEDSASVDGLLCPITGKLMGELMEELASKHRVSREQQDRYSLESHLKACMAQQLGKLDREILPIQVFKRKAILKDDRPRKNLNLTSFRDFPPVFKKGGTVTVGNSSVPCDGAAIVLLASKKYIRRNRLQPSARILGYASITIKPELVFESAITAVTKCLEKCRLVIKDIDLFEISESFAAQAILTKQALDIPSEKLNIFGGDIAFGHPLGAAGARALVTLNNALHHQKKKRGLACVCYGGGGAIALLIEAL